MRRIRRCEYRGMVPRRSMLLATSVALLSGCATTMRITGVQFAEGDPMKICIDDPTACGKDFEKYASKSETSEGDPLYCSIEGPQEENSFTGAFNRTVNSACVDGTWEQPKGTYVLKTQMKCGPKSAQTVTVDGPWSGKFAVESPKPRKAFLDGNRRVGLFPASFKQGLSKDDDWKTAPGFTEMEVLRDWGTGWEPVRCDHSIARIIDAAGVFAPGTLVVVAKNQLTDTRPAGASAAASLAENQESAKRQVQLQQQAKEKFAAITAEEVRSGKCSEERTDELRAVLSNLKLMVENMDRDSVFTLATHEFTVARPNAAPLSVRLGTRGEYHLFAVSHQPVQLELKDRNGSVVNTKSMFHVVASNFGGGYDSRSLEANAGDKATVKLNGSGCALITVFHKL